MLDEFNKSIEKGPICNCICNICWKFEYRTNVFAFDAERYKDDAMFKKCKTTRKYNGDILRIFVKVVTVHYKRETCLHRLELMVCI